MDKKRSILNISVAISFKVILFALSIISRRFLIKYVGNYANGLNSLYLNILGVLSIAELGVGSAITFSMYSPIVKKETEKVAALYGLFVKMYRLVAIVILALGLIITPFIPFFAKGYNNNLELYITFVIMLLSVVFTYVYSAKISLINAYKNNYISTTITSTGQIFLYISQIIVLVIWRSFELFLLCRIVSELLQLILVNIYVKKKHSEIISSNNKLDTSSKNEVLKNIKAMFMHKIGGVLVNSTDSIIISTFISVSVLGLYSNYMAIISAMAGVLSLFFSPITSIIGHLCVTDNTTEKTKWFNILYFLNFGLGCVFYLGYYAVIDYLITLFFGTDLVMSWQIPFIITINYFIQFMRQTVLLFRDATGAFYNDRWKPVIEGVANLVLSLLLVQWMGIVGVILITIMTNLLICHTIEPFVLHKHVFGRKPFKYYILNFGCISLFVIMLGILHFAKIRLDSVVLGMIINGFIAIGLSLIPICILFLINKDIRKMVASKIFFKDTLASKKNKLE